MISEELLSGTTGTTTADSAATMVVGKGAVMDDSKAMV